MRRTKSVEERFWPKVIRVGEDDCWEWSGGRIAKGYGQMTAGRRGEGNLLAHRVAYEIANGPIPDGLHVLHECDNPPCCNPAHLFLGTNTDNSEDKYAKGRGNTGERNGQAKLTASRVLEMREAYAAGRSIYALAKESNLSWATVRDAVEGRTWGSIS